MPRWESVNRIDISERFGHQGTLIITCRGDTSHMRAYLLLSLSLVLLETSSALGESNVPVETTTLFADFGHMPRASQGYEGRLFKLSQAFPSAGDSLGDTPAFIQIDYQENWKSYIEAVREYCFAGNIDGGDVDDDFDVARRNAANWFHMPWLHYGPKGREGVHGLTKEAAIAPRQLAWTQTSKGQAYAVAFYNRIAAATIADVWKDHSKPAFEDDATFRPGSVIFKLLFADIPVKEVPSLNPPVLWDAYVTEAYETEKRTFKKLALVQMDVMVRHDDRWVFGTYQYNGAVDASSPWHRLVPLGIQWGNDPDNRDDQWNPEPVKTVINDDLKETIINDDPAMLPPTHLGWNGRLNGPLDNPRSSCMSCHAVAQMQQNSAISPLFDSNPPKPGDDRWMKWFKNYKCGERFDKLNPSADFSLQLAMSVQNWQSWTEEATSWNTEVYRDLSWNTLRQKSRSRNPFGDLGTPEGGATISRDLANPQPSSNARD